MSLHLFARLIFYDQERATVECIYLFQEVATDVIKCFKERQKYMYV